MKYFPHVHFATLFTGILFVFSVFFFSGAFLSADTSVYGWLWGGSDDGAGINTGIGWISMSNTTDGSAISYGVSIPADDGNLLGYAYSENMGYIAFDNMTGYLTGCPSGTCAAYRESDTIKGWARFVGIADAGVNAGGNEGWIHLSGTAQDSSPYGVTINPDGTLSGYAWSDEFGAIDFGQSGVSMTSECSDGIDNDGDGDIDLADIGCTHISDTSEVNTACSNGIDDDGDGWIDIADPGCYQGGIYMPDDNDESNSEFQCSNGLDDDGDTFFDGFDSECTAGDDDSEAPLSYFSLSAGSISIPAGSTQGSTHVTLTPYHAYGESVSLSIQSIIPTLPSEISLSLDDTTLTPSEYAAGAPLRATVSGPIGTTDTYTIRIQGDDGALIRNVDVTLDVSGLIDDVPSIDYSEF